MRSCLIVLPMLLSACEDRGVSPVPSPAPSFARHPATGELRARIATGRGVAAELRSGATVPVALPSGFTIYPGSTVVRSTVVERGGTRRTLVEFDTPDPIAKVLSFHRTQAQAAGLQLTLDLGGDEHGSIGGALTGGGVLVIAARQIPLGTRVEISAD